MEKIVLTGGGTAGHITPNIALIPLLEGFEIHYIGAPDSMEKELVGKIPGVIFHEIEPVKFVRGSVFKNFGIPFKLYKAKKQAKAILAEIKPKAVFSKGGYVALPVMLAAKNNIPTLLHESDYSMGLANKLAVKKCVYVMSSFSHVAARYQNGVHTGSPLRQDIYNGKKENAARESGLNGRKNLLIFGGSLGAKAINEAVYSSLESLTGHFDVVHITGKNAATPPAHARYFTLPFTQNIKDYFAWADVVVSRGGANALFELMALRKPTVIIPLPKGNSRGDQEDNARYFFEKGCALLLRQENLTPKSLLDAVLKADSEGFMLRQKMFALENIDGTKKIASLIIEAAKR